MSLPASLLLRRHFLQSAGAGLASLLSGCGDDRDPVPAAGATPDAGGLPGYEPNVVPAGEAWWLVGNYAPTDAETDATDLPVEGTLPPELDGLYVRNGPNPIFGESTHWFVGDGMVHGVRLRGGKAEWYRNRYIDTPLLDRAPGTPLIPDLVNHPANTSLVDHGGRLFALAETGLPYELSPADLSTLGPHDYGGALDGAMTAHPKLDPVTGELLFFGYSFAAPFLTFRQVDAAGALVRSEVIDLAEGSMMHDFAITERFVIFLDVPVVVNLDLLDTGIPLGWSDTHPLRAGIMPRDGASADVTWVELPHGMIVHTLNAYDLPDGKIVLEAAWMPELWRTNNIDFNTSPSLWRFVIDPAAGSATAEQVDERIMDFPQFNRTLLGRPHRYGYGVHFGEYQGPESLAATTGILKYDRDADTVAEHELPIGTHSDEVVFVPAAGASAEDEGYLIGFAHDARADEPFLAVYDAQAMTRLAKIPVPHRVPAGFHGWWLPQG